MKMCLKVSSPVTSMCAWRNSIYESVNKTIGNLSPLSFQKKILFFPKYNIKTNFTIYLKYI